MPPEFFEQPEYRLFRRAFAEKKAPLVIICGSGLSQPAGLPSWPRLRVNLQRQAERKEATLNQLGQALIGQKVRAARQQPDMWIAFKLLKEVLTPPVFDNLIEQELSPADEAPIPAAYTDLLRLQPRGLVTLNLDKFAGEALSRHPTSEIVTPIYGKELAQKWNVLHAAKTYLIYLHGGIHDSATWVLTQDDLSDLTSSAGHAHFLRTTFTDNLVLFAGISADDVALSGRLLELTKAGFRPKNLYWLTTRLDGETSRWASDAYVSLIHYSAPTEDDHALAIKAFVENCLDFISEDEPQPPLVGSGRQFSEEAAHEPVDPEELAQQEPEEVRRVVAARLDDVLTDSSDERDLYQKYRAFCAEYDYALHRAFYRGRKEKYRNWFGYKLQMPSLGRGNFGEVYSALDGAGNIVAIKIMHDSIFGNDDMLGGFRRGVRSMEIVTQHEVKGMVPIIESFELPPTIVMPFIRGHSLQESLSIRPDLPWEIRLVVGREIGRIVAEGHALPETILHRDIKPSNIMIANLEYDGVFDPEIFVLDFDMSWHKGSKEKDVIFESRDDFGFLAPEQTDPGNRYAARSTRVDSYGFGMTLFYMFGLQSPRPNEALSDQWFKRAVRAAGRGYQGAWKSAPTRLGRLIFRATQVDQNERVDFATIVRELSYLETAVRETHSLDNVELWAEETLCRIAAGVSYQWDDAVGSGRIETPSGLDVSTAVNFRDNLIQFSIRYMDRGIREKGNLARYIVEANGRAEKVLSPTRWSVTEARTTGHEASLKAECRLADFRADAASLFTSAVASVAEFKVVKIR